MASFLSLLAAAAIGASSPPLVVDPTSPDDFAAGAIDCWMAANAPKIDQGVLAQRGWRKLAFVNGDKQLPTDDAPKFTRVRAVADANSLPTTVIDLPKFGEPLTVCRAEGHFRTEEEIQAAKDLLSRRLQAIDSAVGHTTHDRGNQIVDEFLAEDRTANLFRFKSLKRLHFLVDYRPAEKK